MKKLSFPGGKSVRLARVCVRHRSSRGQGAASRSSPRSLRSACGRSGQLARGAQLGLALLTCALSSDHFLRRLPSGVTAPAVLLPAAPANI